MGLLEGIMGLVEGAVEDGDSVVCILGETLHDDGRYGGEACFLFNVIL